MHGGSHFNYLDNSFVVLVANEAYLLSLWLNNSWLSRAQLPRPQKPRDVTLKWMQRYDLINTRNKIVWYEEFCIWWTLLSRILFKNRFTCLKNNLTGNIKKEFKAKYRDLSIQFKFWIGVCFGVGMGSSGGWGGKGGWNQVHVLANHSDFDIDIAISVPSAVQLFSLSWRGEGGQDVSKQ